MKGFRITNLQTCDALIYKGGVAMKKLWILRLISAILCFAGAYINWEIIWFLCGLYNVVIAVKYYREYNKEDNEK